MRLKRGKDPVALLACGAIRITDDIRPWLNSVRVARGLSLAELGKLAGMSRVNVAMTLLPGSRPVRHSPTVRSLQRLCQALGVALVLVPVDHKGRTQPLAIRPVTAPDRSQPAIPLQSDQEQDGEFP